MAPRRAMDEVSERAAYAVSLLAFPIALRYVIRVAAPADRNPAEHPEVRGYAEAGRDSFLVEASELVGVQTHRSHLQGDVGRGLTEVVARELLTPTTVALLVRRCLGGGDQHDRRPRHPA